MTFSDILLDRGGAQFNLATFPGIDLSGGSDSSAGMQTACNTAGGAQLYLPKSRIRLDNQVVVPKRTKLLGVAGSQPFVNTDGAVLVGGGALNTDMLVSDNVDTSDYWSHGMLIQGLTFVARPGQTVGSGIRWSPGEGSMLRDCTFYGFPDAGVKLVKQFAPCTFQNVCCYDNRYGLWFSDCNGTALINGLTGDDNLSMVNIEMSTNDPNVWGGGLSITIEGLKTETQATNGANAHDPVIRLLNPNECALKVIGGFSSDQSSLSAGTKRYIHILQNGGSNGYSAQIEIQGVHISKYPILVQDDTVGGQTIAWTPYSGTGSDDFPNFRKVWQSYRAARTIYSDAPSGFTGSVGNADGGQHGLTIQGANAPYIRFQKGVGDLARTGGVGWFVCTGSPNSQITADIGSMCLRTDGGAATTLYVKESGNGTNTGWVAK